MHVIFHVYVCAKVELSSLLHVETPAYCVRPALLQSRLALFQFPSGDNPS